jgi:uncharacterized protein (DUF885 family)
MRHTMRFATPHTLFVCLRLVLLCLPLLAAAQNTVQGQRLMQLLARADREDLALTPQAAVLRGELSSSQAAAGEFGDLITDAWFNTAATQLRQRLAVLQRIPRARLNATEKIAYDVALYQHRFALRGHDEGHHRINRRWPLDPVFGQHLAFAQFSSGSAGAPYQTRTDFEAGLARFDGFVLYLERCIQRMQEGMASGHVLPLHITDKLVAQLDAALAQAPIDSPFYQPVRQMPPALADSDRERFAREYRDAVAKKLHPAFERLRSFLSGPYRAAKRPAAPGRVAVPGGKALYEYELESHTTIRMPAQEIHRLGLQEVARIRGQIDAIRQQLGFVGTLKDFFAHLQEDARLRFGSAAELIAAYETVGVQVARRLPALFHRQPQAALQIRPVPAEQETSASGAYYIVGNVDGSRPGVFYVNTGQLPTRTALRTTALYLHEATPGHHLQASLAQENTALPPNLRFGWNAGYGEGWALYAEWLGHEMGLYADPYQHLGQLDMEIFRAARLVVDTGLHHHGWSREQALAYMLDNTSLDRAALQAEVDRYIVWPGQATAYKLGELHIRALRREAEQKLGPRFDVRDFHAQVLDSGALPLAVLQNKLRDWINTRLKEKTRAP